MLPSYFEWDDSYTEEVTYRIDDVEIVIEYAIVESKDVIKDMCYSALELNRHNDHEADLFKEMMPGAIELVDYTLFLDEDLIAINVDRMEEALERLKGESYLELVKVIDEIRLLSWKQ